MNRRSFLSTTGMAALAGTAGCLNLGSESRSVQFHVVNYTEDEIFGLGRLLLDEDVIGVLEFELPPRVTSATTQFTTQISEGAEFVGEVTVNDELEYAATMTADCDTDDERTGDGVIFRVRRGYIEHQAGCNGAYDAFPLNQHENQREEPPDRARS